MGGASTKKKNEKKQDFKKTKLKVGKSRPKNTNATDTSFTAKSIVLKQQSLNESNRSIEVLFNHNLSLLSSKTSTQRHDALAFLTATLHTTPQPWPQPPSFILAKTQALILDGTASVRSQLLKLFKALPPQQLGPLDQPLLYVRAAMTHLSSDIRSTALDVLDWLLDIAGEAVVSAAGGWVKLLMTFQKLLSWGGANVETQGKGEWSAAKPATGGGVGGSGGKLLVHQLSTLGKFLGLGLKRPDELAIKAMRDAMAARAGEIYPLWDLDAHLLPAKANPYGYLNLFGAPRDFEGEAYESVEQRAEALVESGMFDAFLAGVTEAKKEGGEVGRASSGVTKALAWVEMG